MTSLLKFQRLNGILPRSSKHKAEPQFDRLVESPPVAEFAIVA